MEDRRMPLKVPVQNQENSSLVDKSKYPSNSHEKKEPAKLVAKASRKTSTKSILSMFFQEDFKTVLSYVMEDIVGPRLKELILEAVNGGLSASFFGTKSSGSPKRNDGRTPYNSMYRGGDPQRRPPTHSKEKRATLEFDDIVWKIKEYRSPMEAKEAAESVLRYLQDRLREFPNGVTVADFYEAAGVGSDFTDDKYGWRDLTDAEVVRTREGYMIDLPRAELLV